MTDNEIIEELSALLCLLPGVSVAWKQNPPGRYRIGLRVEDYKSLALFGSHALEFCDSGRNRLELCCIARRSYLPEVRFAHSGPLVEH